MQNEPPENHTEQGSARGCCRGSSKASSQPPHSARSESPEVPRNCSYEHSPPHSWALLLQKGEIQQCGKNRRPLSAVLDIQRYVLKIAV